MRNLFLVFPFLLLIFSCGDTAIKNKMPDTAADTSVAVHQPEEPPKPKSESFEISYYRSSFTCTRSKTVKEVDKQIKIGNSTMNLKMDNASFSATTNIGFRRGASHWLSIDKKLDGATIVLNMDAVHVLLIGKDKRPEIGSPEYLESQKYPAAMLWIRRLDSIPGSSEKVNVVCDLRIKDTTGQVTFPAKVEFANSAHPEIPTRLEGDFHIDGIKWALNPKDAKVIKDDLAFHIVLVTLL